MDIHAIFLCYLGHDGKRGSREEVREPPLNAVNEEGTERARLRGALGHHEVVPIVKTHVWIGNGVSTPRRSSQRFDKRGQRTSTGRAKVWDLHDELV